MRNFVTNARLILGKALFDLLFLVWCQVLIFDYFVANDDSEAVGQQIERDQRLAVDR